MRIFLTAYHGTAPDAPLVGGQDLVSNQHLQALWASNSYFLAAQFQDGEVRKLDITLENPFVMDCAGQSVHHAGIVRDVMMHQPEHDGVVFLDTIDGMEVGDVVAVFGRKSHSTLSVAHAVKVVGTRTYDHDLDQWISKTGFAEHVDDLPQRPTWQIPPTPMMPRHP